MSCSETWSVALPAHVTLKVFSLAHDPVPTDGVVSGQHPAAGTEVKWGTEVTLYLDFPERRPVS